MRLELPGVRALRLWCPHAGHEDDPTRRAPATPPGATSARTARSCHGRQAYSTSRRALSPRLGHPRRPAPLGKAGDDRVPPPAVSGATHSGRGSPSRRHHSINKTISATRGVPSGFLVRCATGRETVRAPRHAEVVARAGGRCQGTEDAPLSRLAMHYPHFLPPGGGGYRWGGKPC